MSARSRVSTASLLDLALHGAPEEVCAAAIVIGVLAPRTATVVKTVIQALETAAPPIKPYLMDTLGRIGTPAALDAVVPYLAISGALREQAQRIVAASDDGAVPGLRRLAASSTEVTVLEAIARGAAKIGSEASVGVIADLISRAGPELARTLHVTVRRHVAAWDPPVRTALLERLLGLLAEAQPVGDQIAALSVLSALSDPRGLRAVVERIGPRKGRSQAVQLQALEALTHFEIPARRLAGIVRTIRRVLDPMSPRLAVVALRTLGAIDAQALDLATLLELSRAENPDVGREAIAGLGRFPASEVSARLLEALSHPNAHVVHAASAALGEMTGGSEALVEAHLDPAYAAHRGLLRRLLASRSDPIRDALWRRTILLYRASEAPEDTPLVLLLATLDRARLNTTLERRASKAVRAGSVGTVISELEPLVRNRIATPEGRYLLALAHLTAGAAALDGPHGERALHLLAPLARLDAWSLSERLTRAPTLPPATVTWLRQRFASGASADRAFAEQIRVPE